MAKVTIGVVNQQKGWKHLTTGSYVRPRIGGSVPGAAFLKTEFGLVRLDNGSTLTDETSLVYEPITEPITIQA